MGSAQTSAGACVGPQSVALESSLRIWIWFLWPYLAAAGSVLPVSDPRACSGISEGWAVIAPLLFADSAAWRCRALAIRDPPGATAVGMVPILEPVGQHSSYPDCLELHE